jgi:hypothetical protein
MAIAVVFSCVDTVNLSIQVCYVRRIVWKRTPSTHPLQGDELRALRRLERESPSSPFVFVSERGTPFTTAGFARMIERAARRRLGLGAKSAPAHASPCLRLCPCEQGARHTGNPEMAWPSVDYVNGGLYALAPNRFRDFWRD